jgi:beta-lactamase regulating signal transducer with metallopeptidase domain
MRKETFFKLSRIALLFIVLASVIIPFICLPQSTHPFVPIKFEPIFQNNSINEKPVQTIEISSAIQSSVPASDTIQPIVFSTKTIVLFIYLTGVFISLLLFFYSIGSVLQLIRKSRKTDLNGIHLMIANDDIQPFSFRRRILISQHDYNTNAESILTHELSHIRQGHFYDLMLMELVKIIYWFNPLVYRMDRDLKEIHEFQADEQTLNSGIDATKYQLLIIQKCVGPQRFALANSFNNCQIKKRINMMNKSKTSKAWRWKVATFLPLLALLLMAFGKRGENVPEKINLTEKIIAHPSVNQKQNEQFKQKIEIKKDGSPEKVQAMITGYKMNDTIKMADFLKLSEISLNNREYSVLSFQLAFDENDDKNGISYIAHSNSNKITEEQKNIFSKRKDKTKDIIRIYIESIRAQNSQGKIIDIPPLIYSLKIK